MRAAILAIVFALARVAAAGVTVDADVDDAACSLREAIVAANTDADYHGCVEVLSNRRARFAPLLELKLPER
jgi:CSLREA domain-containing protein